MALALTSKADAGINKGKDSPTLSVGQDMFTRQAVQFTVGRYEPVEDIILIKPKRGVMRALENPW